MHVDNGTKIADVTQHEKIALFLFFGIWVLNAERYQAGRSDKNASEQITRSFFWKECYFPEDLEVWIEIGIFFEIHV